jgi:hypothetical protein
VVRWRKQASTIVQHVALEAAGAGQSFRGLAEVGNSHTDLVGVEGPSVGALKTESIRPDFAAGISGRGDVAGGVDASGALQVVASIAAGAVASGLVEGAAEVGDWLADLVLVESPEIRALIAGLGVVVPNFAAGITAGRLVVGVIDASAFQDVVAEEAAGAETLLVVFTALVADGHTVSVLVEHPLEGTYHTHIFLVVPGLAAAIGGLGVVGGGVEAVPVHQVVAEEAARALTNFGVSLAEIGDGDAGLVAVESPFFRTFETEVSFPGLATKISRVGDS